MYLSSALLMTRLSPIVTIIIIAIINNLEHSATYFQGAILTHYP